MSSRAEIWSIRYIPPAGKPNPPEGLWVELPQLSQQEAETEARSRTSELSARFKRQGAKFVAEIHPSDVNRGRV